MKKVIWAGLFFIITVFALFLSFTTSAKAGAACNRFLDKRVWDCYGSGGNCCDDVVIYG